MAHKLDFELAAPEQIEAVLGHQLEQLRLNRNISQAQLADEAGVSLRTISRLAQGGGISLDTFIRVLGALGLLPRLAELLPDPQIQPVQRVRNKAKPRQRVRKPAKTQSRPWSWQDDAE